MLSVIPEFAAGGYPESRKITAIGWIPDLDFVSSGMTIVR
jgi:hypothetical protein